MCDLTPSNLKRRVPLEPRYGDNIHDMSIFRGSIDHRFSTHPDLPMMLCSSVGRLPTREFVHQFSRLYGIEVNVFSSH